MDRLTKFMRVCSDDKVEILDTVYIKTVVGSRNEIKNEKSMSLMNEDVAKTEAEKKEKNMTTTYAIDDSPFFLLKQSQSHIVIYMQ